MSRLVPSTLAHLTDAHLDYFRHWCHLLHLESSAERRSQSPGGAAGIWLQSASERFVHLLPIYCSAWWRWGWGWWWWWWQWWWYRHHHDDIIIVVITIAIVATTTPFHCNKGQGLYSAAGSDHQVGPKAIPKRENLIYTLLKLTRYRTLWDSSWNHIDSYITLVPR